METLALREAKVGHPARRAVGKEGWLNHELCAELQGEVYPHI